MENLLKKLKKENNNLQNGLSESSERTVNKLLCEMDAARMGAVDREVVRRDLISMVQERELLGNPMTEELQEEEKQMCHQIITGTGFRSRLENQLYIVMCIQMFFVIDDITLILKNAELNLGVMAAGLFLNAIWYYVIYLGFRQKCLFGKRAYPISPILWIAVLFIGIFILNILSVVFHYALGTIITQIPIYIGIVLDIFLLIVAVFSYRHHNNSQCKKYNIA